VAEEKHYKEEKKTFRDGIERGQMILVKNMKFNNMTSGGGIQEIIIIVMRGRCCIKIRRNLLRI
jgi:hypothetical protein